MVWNALVKIEHVLPNKTSFSIFSFDRLFCLLARDIAGVIGAWHSAMSYSPHRELKNVIARVTYGVSRVIVFLNVIHFRIQMRSRWFVVWRVRAMEQMAVALDRTCWVDWISGKKKSFPKLLHIISAISSSSVTVSIQKGLKRANLSKIEYITVRLVSRDFTVVTAHQLSV